MSVPNAGRYDRQVRIWGAHGQQRLENANVCVLYGGPCASEALKNLVLGGIGSFTLVDDAVVSDADFGKNYLVDVEGYGEPLVVVVSRLLRELNDAVRGTAVRESPAELLATRPDFFRPFSLIIATQLRREQLKQLAAICKEARIPLVAVRSYGLLGTLKVFVEERCVVETKPDDEVPDLRLGSPWPELTEFVESFKMEEMTDVQHSHVPYAVILLKAAQKWRQMADVTTPMTAVQKREFRSVIQQLRRSDKASHIEEENFEEAFRAAYQLWTPYSISQNVEEILQDACTQVDRTSSDFWIVVAALKKFREETGHLPLPGSIPDMTATTESYLKLQAIYAAKAETDVERVKTLVGEILERLDLPSEQMSSERIVQISRNARSLRLVRSWPALLSEDPNLLSRLRDKDTFRNVGFGLLLEAVDVFYQTHARLPGTGCGEDWTEDAHLLIKSCQSIADVTALEQELQSEMLSMAQEVCRFGGGELHNVSAVMGGIAAQEAIKLITHQFVPFKGTLIYNAMNSTTSKF